MVRTSGFTAMARVQSLVGELRSHKLSRQKRKKRRKREKGRKGRKEERKEGREGRREEDPSGKARKSLRILVLYLYNCKMVALSIWKN